MNQNKKTKTRVLFSLVAALLMVFGISAAGYAVVADGDVSDIRALPYAVELDDPDGWLDEPILGSQVGGFVDPSGFNISSMVLAYDPDLNNGTYYIGIDVSTDAVADTSPYDSPTGVWDADGDGWPETISDGATMTPPIGNDDPEPLSGLDEQYKCSIDIGNTGAFVILLTALDEGAGPTLLPPEGPGAGSLTVTSGWGSMLGPYTGDGPDLEFVVGNLRDGYGGIADCAFYTVRIRGFADTDEDSAEERVTLVFELPRPITICKVDDQGAPIAGWEFTVSGTGVDGQDGLKVTDGSGCVTVLVAYDYDLEQYNDVTICEQLPQLAKNVISEVLVNGTPVEPVDMGDGLYCVTVLGSAVSECCTVTFENECSANIEVYKYNLEDCEGDLLRDAPVEGFEFCIVEGPGITEPVCETTDGSGKATFTVTAPGDYVICESLPQSGIPKNVFCTVLVDEETVAEPGDGPWCAVVPVSCGTLEEKHTVEFFNSRETIIEVYKYNLEDCEDEAPGTPVQDFEFCIVAGPDIVDPVCAVTDAGGKATFTVTEVGTYTICEGLPQAGIPKNVFCRVLVDDEPVAEPGEGPWCADVEVNGEETEPHTVAFYNACETTIEVYKYNLEDCEDEAPGTPVQDFEFCIVAGPDIVDPVCAVTDAGGKATFTVAAPGTYTICEALPQAGIPKNKFCRVLVDDEPVVEPGEGPWCADVTVDCEETEPHTVAFYNACETTIEVYKYHLDDCEDERPGTPVQDFEFCIVAGPGIIDPVCAVTDVAGKATFTVSGAGTYTICETLPQGDETEFCDVTVDGEPAMPTGDTDTWCVDVTVDCEETVPHTVVFHNAGLCEIEVKLCKTGIESEECDELADSGPVPGWHFTLQKLPDGPVEPYTTGGDGCTGTILLEPGDYQVCETLDPGFVFCWIGSEPLIELIPVPDGDTVCYNFTVDCEDVSVEEPDITITYTNAGGGATRTPGYWFTHPRAMLAAFDCITGSEEGTIVLCESDSCEVTADDAEAIFWRSKGGNRPTLAKHILAAMFNSCLLGAVPPAGIIEDGLEVLCNPNATSMQIGDVLGPLADFNESGTEQDVEGLDYGNAEPDVAKSMAAAGEVPDCAAGKRIRDRGSRGR